MYKVGMWLLEVTDHNLLFKVQGSSSFEPTPCSKSMENLCPMAYLCFSGRYGVGDFSRQPFPPTCEVTISWRPSVLSTLDLGGKRGNLHLRVGSILPTMLES